MGPLCYGDTFHIRPSEFIWINMYRDIFRVLCVVGLGYNETLSLRPFEVEYVQGIFREGGPRKGFICLLPTISIGDLFCNKTVSA